MPGEHLTHDQAFEAVKTARRPLTLGAIFDGTATTFRVWAPERKSVEVVQHVGAGFPGLSAVEGSRTLTRDDHGYWSGRYAGVGPGVRYQYRLDGSDDSVFPDPASRWQPDGVHGASMVIDPSRFEWTDGAWVPPTSRDLVFYELHVGTFTPEGTFRSAIERLPHLARLGVTAIELMPVGDFPGSRNWGYDGVAIFAPARCYGTPDDLRALVDAAHRHGLAVVLDVVYNHLGPDGAYANAFSPYYFASAHQTAWGAGVNLDGPHSAEVRRFFIENALHWVREYHVDGLRLDATHAMRDDSPTHFLAELAATMRETGPRPVLLVAEDHRNVARLTLPLDEGGYGLDGVWADDFHHEVRVHTAGDREGYYADYTGTTEELAATLRQGWFYTGQISAHHGAPRGTSAAGLAPRQFVVCLQNHDQIGNRADGARLHHEIDAATYRAATTLLLMAPQMPLLFMGQEWAAGAPFLFFTDHHDELGRQVTEGRRSEFRAFAAFAEARRRAEIPDPQQVETFLRSRLDWTEASRAPHSHVLSLYRELLAFRRLPAVRDATCRSYSANALDGHTVAVEFATPGGTNPERLLVVVRLSGGGDVTLPKVSAWHDTLITTEDERFAADPAPILLPVPASRSSSEDGTFTIQFARPGAVVLRIRPQDPRPR
jgi:maltooligosyltrehalose trehalohydrolase